MGFAKSAIFVVFVSVIAVFFSNYFSDSGILALFRRDKSDSISRYDSFYDQSPEEKLSHYDQEGTDLYYNVATDFYEYGWGDSFHFGIGQLSESRLETITALEHYVALKLGLKEGMKVADLGCGVGGPLRSIASFSGADITGLTINEYQVKRAELITKQTLSPNTHKNIHFMQGDFTKTPFDDNTFDAIYTIEAMVHVTDRSHAYAEAYRILKPGGLFLNIDWVMTDRYDPTNIEHKAIKRGIEHGDGLPELITRERNNQYYADTEFEILEESDLTERSIELYGDKNQPWYTPLKADLSWEGWRQSNFGRRVLDYLLVVLEGVGIAPEGSLQTKRMLDDAAINLRLGGEMRIFTPAQLIVARKPQ